MIPLTRCLALLLFFLSASVLPLRGQSPVFGTGPVSIVTEWKGLDRGDGSGAYELVTRATDPASGMSIEYAQTITRNVDGEEIPTEKLRVLNGESERSHGSSSPASLGLRDDAAAVYAIAFNAEFVGQARKNYRPSDKRVREIAHSVEPEAKVSTRPATDGRTTADVEIPGVHPVDVLAGKFLAIRRAFRDAEVGLAKLRIRGTASAPIEGSPDDDGR